MIEIRGNRERTVRREGYEEDSGPNIDERPFFHVRLVRIGPLGGSIFGSSIDIDHTRTS